MLFYRDIICREIAYKAHRGEKKLAYFAYPDQAGPMPGIVFLHHHPGWNDINIDATRKLAHHGFMTICPNLFQAWGGKSRDPSEIGKRARKDGGVHDDQTIGDIEGAIEHLTGIHQHNGKIGVIGFCSGGRFSFMAAGRIPDKIDAAIDCWGGRVITHGKPSINPKLDLNWAIEPITYAPNIQCPIMGIFGNRDKDPGPEQVDETEEILKSLGKTYEFHRYDADHSFMDYYRERYQPKEAVDAWDKIIDFFNRHLKDQHEN